MKLVDVLEWSMEAWWVREGGGRFVAGSYVHLGACRVTRATASSGSWPPGALVAGVLIYSGIATAETRANPSSQQALLWYSASRQSVSFGLPEDLAAELGDANTRYETQEAQVIQHESVSW